MGIIPILIGLPVLTAAVLAVVRSSAARGYVVYAGAGGVMALALMLLTGWLRDGGQACFLYEETAFVNHGMMAVEVFLTGLILFLSVRFKRYLIGLLSLVQTALLFYVEFTAGIAENSHMLVDGLALDGSFSCSYNSSALRTRSRKRRSLRHLMVSL